jgi:hypothetical protein
MKPITKLKPETVTENWTELWMQNVEFWNVDMSWLQYSTNFLYKN